MSKKEAEKQLIRYCREHGVFWFPNDTDGDLPRRGTTCKVCGCLGVTLVHENNSYRETVALIESGGRALS